MIKQNHTIQFAPSGLPRQVVAFSTLQKARLCFAFFILALCFATDLFSWPLKLPYLPLIQAALFLLFSTALLAYFQHLKMSLLLLIQLSLLLDVLLITELLILTGGSSNPLTFLYLFPILTAALLCPPRFTWAISVLTIGTYLLLFFWHWPFPVMTSDPYYLLNIHLVGMWLTFALSVILMTIWVSGLANTIRQHERRQAEAHKRQQEEEYWLSLGMEAAGIAHRLSTPLNNMILISEEISHCDRLPEDIREDMNLLDIQLQECKETLWKLKYQAEYTCCEINLYQTLAQHLADWSNLRPDVHCIWHKHPEDKAEYSVILDETFWLAFLNILNNAADAGDNEINLYTQMHANHQWEIGIHNRNGFLSAHQLEKAGLDCLDSDKPSGLGLGVRLSHATLSRLSGSLTLLNHPKGGVYARIMMPITVQKERDE